MKKRLIIEIQKLQGDILINFGNTAYVRLLNDFNYENIPSELYELWYSPHKFSFKKLIDFKEIPNKKNDELLEYYSKLIILKYKLEVIFDKILLQKLNFKLKAKQLNKIIKMLKGEINNGKTYMD